MSESPKYTPGPWVYAPNAPHYSNAPYMVWTSRGPGHGTVANTNSGGLMPTDPERQAADAQLIASAPAYAVEVANLLTAWEHDSETVLIAEAIERLKAVHARATGETF